MAASPLANPRATRALLESYGLATKHRLGQNFLVSDAVVEKILGLAALSGTETVLEVGPGIGTLTRALLAHAGQVVAVEADPELEPVLADLADATVNFRYIMGDALRVSPAELAAAAGGEPTLLVANLPYNVAATLILQLFQTMPALETAVVMVQAEVADRICAAPGNKTYGAYTVKLAQLARPAGRFEVAPSSFMPAPHVDSAVVRLERTAAYTPEQESIARVVDAAFAQRRKTIRNSMAASGFEKSALDAAFAACGIAPAARAETLQPADFVRLTACLESCSD